jgi:hypothetical protein
MEEIGNIGHVPSLYKPPTNPSVFIYNSIYSQVDDDEWFHEYQCAYPNAKSECLSAAKYDHVVYDTVDPDALQWAKELVREIIQPAVAGWGPWSTERARDECVANSYAGLWYEWQWKKWGVKRPCQKKDVLEGFFGNMDIRFLEAIEAGDFPDETPIWRNLTKEELLKLKKYLTEEFRSLAAPPFDLYLAQVKYFGDFNGKLKEYSARVSDSTGMKLSNNPMSGGMYDVIENLRDFVVSESDLSWYDSTQMRCIQDAVHEIKKDLMSSQPDRVYDILDYLHRCAVEGPIALSNGQVFKKNFGQNSGDFNTSTNNTCIRLLVLAYAWYVLMRSKYPKDGLCRDAFKSLWKALLGDDEILALPADVAPFFSLEKRAQVIESDLGMLVKRETPDTFGPDGHTFLGFTFLPDDHGVIRPTFNGARLLAGAAKPVFKGNDRLAFERIYGLSMLSLYATKVNGHDVYDVLRNTYNDLKRRYHPPKGMEVYPTRAELGEMWYGYESNKTRRCLATALPSLGCELSPKDFLGRFFKHCRAEDRKQTGFENTVLQSNMTNGKGKGKQKVATLGQVRAAVQSGALSQPKRGPRKSKRTQKAGKMGGARSAPLAVGSFTRPYLSVSGDDTKLVVTVRQYLGDVHHVASGVPSLQNFFMLTRGAGTSRIQRLLSMFETYKMKKLVVDYVPNESASTKGKVAMRFDPNIEKLATTMTRREINETTGVVSTASWVPARLVVASATMDTRKQFFVDSNLDHAESPVEVSGHAEHAVQGAVQVYTDGFTNDGVSGELWATMTVVLYTWADGDLSHHVVYDDTNPKQATPGDPWSTATRRIAETAADFIKIHWSPFNSGVSNARHFDITEPGTYHLVFNAIGTSLGLPTIALASSDTYVDGTPVLTLLDRGIEAAGNGAYAVYQLLIPENSKTHLFGTAQDTDRTWRLIPTLAAATTLTRMFFSTTKL